MCRVVSRKVPNDRWVPYNPLVYDDQLIHDDHQGGTCREGKVLDNRWVPNDPLVHDGQLICADCQGGACRAS